MVWRAYVEEVTVLPYTTPGRRAPVWVAPEQAWRLYLQNFGLGKNMGMLLKVKNWLSATSIRKTASDEFSIPVLCYHSWTIGDSYKTDNHLAMEQDLIELAKRGYQILPVERLVSVLKGDEPASAIAHNKLVCITFDDGKRWDFYDGYRKDGSQIKSFRTILSESRSAVPTFLSGARSVAFVIASPEERLNLSLAVNEPYSVLTDDWWQKSAAEGIVGIANHSWDHLHVALTNVRQADNKKGSFFDIETYADAKGQIIDAQSVVDRITGNRSVPVFGYPYGHVSSYLKESFFPEHGNRIGINGALSTAGKPVDNECCIWDIPRFVCGYHWKSSADFSTLLNNVESRAIFNT